MPAGGKTRTHRAFARLIDDPRQQLNSCGRKAYRPRGNRRRDEPVKGLPTWSSSRRTGAQEDRLTAETAFLFVSDGVSREDKYDFGGKHNENQKKSIGISPRNRYGVQSEHRSVCTRWWYHHQRDHQRRNRNSHDDGVNYVRATLNGTTNYTASEYSLRTATITFAASEEATSDDVDLTENDDGTYTASADLFNKCADVYVGDTLYRFAAGLKSGDVTIDANDPWKVDFTIGGESFTNNAYNVQNPDIGTSTEPDGWTGIAYTVRGTLPAGSDISALAMTVEKNNADATVSGSCVTSEGGDDYTLNLSGTDKMITVTYDDMTRNYYVAATVTGSGKINVTIMIDASNADVAYPTQVSEIDSKMGTASGDNTGYVRLEIDSGKTVYDALVDATTTAGITIGAQNSRRLCLCDRRHWCRWPCGLDVLCERRSPHGWRGQLCSD